MEVNSVTCPQDSRPGSRERVWTPSQVDSHTLVCYNLDIGDYAGGDYAGRANGVKATEVATQCR